MRKLAGVAACGSLPLSFSSLRRSSESAQRHNPPVRPADGKIAVVHDAIGPAGPREGG
jgi:hypothetical protein